MPHSLSGQLGATFGAAPLIAQLAAWNVPEKVQVDLVVEGASSKFSALVALNAERQRLHLGGHPASCHRGTGPSTRAATWTPRSTAAFGAPGRPAWPLRRASRRRGPSRRSGSPRTAAARATRSSMRRRRASDRSASVLGLNMLKLIIE